MNQSPAEDAQDATPDSPLRRNLPALGLAFLLLLGFAWLFIWGPGLGQESLQQDFTPTTFEEFEWSPFVIGYTIACAIFYGTLAVWLMFQGRRTA